MAGTGLGAAEEMLLFLELGRHLAPGPFLATVVAAHAAHDAGRPDLAATFASKIVRTSRTKAPFLIKAETSFFGSTDVEPLPQRTFLMACFMGIVVLLGNTRPFGG